MGSMRRRWLLLAVILTAPSGCDNVTWGGTEVHLEAAAEPAPPPPPDTVSEKPIEGMPKGPLLLAGTRQGDTVTLITVAEIKGRDLAELPTDAKIPDFVTHFIRARLAAGTQVILFSDGARVGRLTVSEAHRDDRFCASRAAVTGVVEMVPAAAEAKRFIGLIDTTAAPRPYTEFRRYGDDRDQRVASVALASRAIPNVGAPWPPSVLEARADLQGFRLPEATGPGFAATFLYDDSLAVGEPGRNAYALFVMARTGDSGYETAFRSYRPVADDGKGAPRYFDHVDWNGDGTSEVLLDVFGADHRWFSALTQRDGTWVRSFEDSCGSARD